MTNDQQTIEGDGRTSGKQENIALLDLSPEDRPVVLDEDTQYPVSFDREDITWKGNLRIVRVAEECQHCGANYAIHPHHTRPANVMMCGRCPGHAFGMGYFWKAPALSAFDKEDE